MNNLISDSNEFMHYYPLMQYWYRLDNIWIDLRQIIGIVRSDGSDVEKERNLIPTIYSIATVNRTYVVEEGTEGLQELLNYIDVKTLSPQDLAKQSEALKQLPPSPPGFQELLKNADYIANQLVSDDGLHLKIQNSSTDVFVPKE